MKTKKRLFSILLCVVLAVVALTAMAYAAETETSANVYADVDKTSAFVGDTITVTFSTKAVQCTTLTGGISYDPAQLEFVSVQMAEANGNKLLIQNLNPDAFRMVGVEHNIVNDGEVGRVGFYSVGTERDGVEAENFAATDLFVATFKVLKTGEIKIVVREDSFQGSQNKEVQTITVTATEKSVTVVYKGAALANAFTVEGNVVTVTYTAACKIGYLKDGKYVTTGIVKTKISDNCYSFTVPEGVTEVLLVVKGDITGDGKFLANDKAAINAALSGKITLSADKLFAGDITGDGKFLANDKAAINAILAGKIPSPW